jgi:hypothetical protein
VTSLEDIHNRDRLEGRRPVNTRPDRSSVPFWNFNCELGECQHGHPGALTGELIDLEYVCSPTTRSA